MLSEKLTGAEKNQGLFWLLTSYFLLPTLISAGIPLLFPAVNTAQLNFIYYALNFVAVAVIFRRFWLRAVNTLGNQIPRFLFSTVLGFLGYWSINSALSSILSELVPEFFNVNDSSISETFSQNFPLMALGTAILVPIAEECLYRGLVFGALAEKSIVAAYLVSILAFASIHVFGYIGQYEPWMLLLCLVQYFPAGFCLAWAYRKTDNILSPILIHATVNIIGIFSLR